jgi:hypothetical protein
MTGKLKTDKLAVRVYAKHGDTCSIAPHCESLGCASGSKPSDLVLVSCRSEFVTGNSAGGVRIFPADRPSVGRVGIDIAAEFAS